MLTNTWLRGIIFLQYYVTTFLIYLGGEMKKRYTIDDFSRLIDHTNLKTTITNEEMKQLCDEAKE